MRLGLFHDNFLFLVIILYLDLLPHYLDLALYFIPYLFNHWISHLFAHLLSHLIPQHLLQLPHSFLLLLSPLLPSILSLRLGHVHPILSYLCIMLYLLNLFYLFDYFPLSFIFFDLLNLFFINILLLLLWLYLNFMCFLLWEAAFRYLSLLAFFVLKALCLDAIENGPDNWFWIEAS